MTHFTPSKGSVASLFLSITLLLLTFCTTSQAQPGITWTTRTTVNNGWYGITFGNGLFVAVANGGTGNRVMTSPDGTAWTTRTSSVDNGWVAVTFGNGLFVAVANSGTGNRVMTSPDGINWTTRVSAADNNWISITYGNGLFVAVATSGLGNGIMTSPDGITWTIRSCPADNSWRSVVYGNGRFVAVAFSGVGNRVMSSPDGITWTIETSAPDNDWLSVTYGNGLFVAVAFSGTGDRVMTSPDGVTWTLRSSAADNNWIAVTYGSNLFVAVSFSGTGNRVMTSPDGITWTLRASAANNTWTGITYANGIFVAVSGSGAGNRVMTSGTFTILPVSLISFSGKNINTVNELFWKTASENNSLHFDIESSSNGISFEKIGAVASAGNSSTIKAYHFTDGNPFKGTTYYRLKQTDIDGKFTYSYIITIQKIAANAVFIFPNPASNFLNIHAGSTYIGSTAQLYNLDGRLLKTIQILQDVQAVNITALARNTYLLKLSDGTILKWIKE